MDKADCMTKFCPLTDGPQNWQRCYFSTFWDLPILNYAYLSHPLWFKIITLTTQTDVVERPNRTDREGMS
jgi:hypothetical protein